MTVVAEATSGLGKFLRELRSSRQVSLSQVAGKAGVAKSTLSKWEKGLFLPRLPEVDAVLDVLNASPEERRQTIQLIDAPRALIHLRQATRSVANEADINLADVPAGGDLLRAMRLRHGKTVDEVAQALGVSGRSIRGWERSDSWPTTEHLHSLCFQLGAAPKELEALLTAGPWLPVPPALTDTASDLEIKLHIYDLAYSLYDPAAEALRDLSYLATEAFLAPRALRQPATRVHLAELYAYYALWLGDNHRYRESARYAERVLDLTRREEMPSHIGFRGALTLARSLVFGGERPATTAGAARGRTLLAPVVTKGPDLDNINKAWGLRQIAEFLALEGKMDTALELSTQAVALVEKNEDPIEARLRRFDRAELLIQAGQASEALPLFPMDRLSEGVPPSLRLREKLIRVRAFLLTNHLAEAHDWLTNAYNLARTHNLNTEDIDSLAVQF